MKTRFGEGLVSADLFDRMLDLPAPATKVLFVEASGEVDVVRLLEERGAIRALNLLLAESDLCLELCRDAGGVVVGMGRVVRLGRET